MLTFTTRVREGGRSSPLDVSAHSYNVCLKITRSMRFNLTQSSSTIMSDISLTTNLLVHNGTETQRKQLEIIPYRSEYEIINHWKNGVIGRDCLGQLGYMEWVWRETHSRPGRVMRSVWGPHGNGMSMMDDSLMVGDGDGTARDCHGKWNEREGGLFQCRRRWWGQSATVRENGLSNRRKQICSHIKNKCIEGYFFAVIPRFCNWI